MMPLQPFWWDLAVFLLCFAGFALLALASEREGKALLRRAPSAAQRLAFRLMGWPLLAAALAVCVLGWRGNFGAVVWFGWLTVAALAVVFGIAYRPWRPAPREPASRLERGRDAERTPAATPCWQRCRRGVAAAGLLVIPAGFGWALYQAPVHPLLRADAVQGRIGPWAFTLVEEEQAAPEDTPAGVPVKHLMLRFCDACEGGIRAAYVQLREPRSSRSKGVRFMGERRQREAVLAIPTAVTPKDQLWLTVVGKDGRTHRAALEVSRVSPATARFIQERTR
ncbi:DUF3325 domain-containing protein [Thauera sinica]|uniref:DUF3325 domain-containing protein n=1 Tax=Thauera sinica TaxID=2665146 RepID=A0ABW1AQ87_9RHOO|nr:DUF3325 domain-containing protein [Thauera sp. K11]